MKEDATFTLVANATGCERRRRVGEGEAPRPPVEKRYNKLFPLL